MRSEDEVREVLERAERMRDDVLENGSTAEIVWTNTIEILEWVLSDG